MYEPTAAASFPARRANTANISLKNSSGTANASRVW